MYAKKKPEALEVAREPATLSVTEMRIASRASLLRGKLGSTSDEDEIDDIEDELEILAYLDRLIADSTRGKPIVSANVEAERILNLLENVDAGSGKMHNFSGMLTGMLPTALAGHRIPGSGGGSHGQPIGYEAAARESSFLYNPERKNFYVKQELAAMSSGEIARLDVGPGHHTWYRREETPADPLASFQSSMEQGVAAALREKDDLPEGADWDLRTSRRVLFMDKVYKSATSAKARVEDAYGAEWKMKWGDEVQSEPVCSSLYLLAGAKMTDLVVAGGGGPEEMILILSKKGDYDSKDKEEREPWNVDQLTEALDDYYGFDLVPYIHSKGVIDPSNVDRLLRNLPEGGKKKLRKSELIGRHWVSFREFSLELRPKGYIRDLDGASFSDLAATEDRAARGLYVFSLWISARDAKDDNNKTYFVRKPGAPRDKAIIAHFDGQHDLGSTLGALGSAGRVNAMPTGDDFLRINASGNAVVGRQTFVYKPASYWNATWADAKWMAGRISSLSDSQLRQAVATSQWPDFMRETLFYKLAARRNQLARVFGWEDAAAPDPAPPEISIDFGSPALIREAEERYRLAPGSLADELARRGGNQSGRETLVTKGEVVPSEESALIHQLILQRHPAGLTDRYHRMFNRHPKALREDGKSPVARPYRNR